MNMANFPVSQRYAVYEAGMARGALKVRLEERDAAVAEASRRGSEGDLVGCQAWHLRAMHHEEQANLLMQVIGGTLLHREPSVRLLKETDDHDR